MTLSLVVEVWALKLTFTTLPHASISFPVQSKNGLLAPEAPENILYLNTHTPPTVILFLVAALRH